MLESQFYAMMFLFWIELWTVETPRKSFRLGCVECRMLFKDFVNVPQCSTTSDQNKSTQVSPDIVFIYCHSVPCKPLFCGYSVVFVWYLNPDINQFVDLTATSTKFPPPPLFCEAHTRPQWWFVPSDIITRWLQILNSQGESTLFYLKSCSSGTN